MEQRSFQGFHDDLSTCLLVSFQSINQFLQNFCRMDVSRTTTCDNTFFYSCFGSCQSIFHTQFCFFHFCLSSCTNTYNCYTTCQFCQSFLQFFTVKFRCCLFDLSFDLVHSCFDSFFIAFTINNNSAFFLNFYRFRATKLFQSCFFQIQSQFVRDHLTTCQNSDILQHFFSSVTITRCFYSCYRESSSQFVYDQSCQSFTFDVLCDDQQFGTGLYNLL